MKATLAIAAVIVSGWSTAFAAEIPALETPVNDRAGVLSQPEIERLDREVVRLRVETGAQIALLVVRTTGGVPIEDFTFQVAEKWGGGSGKRDDGLLLVLALDDRRSRLDVGYDLEDRLPDARVRHILDAMAPSMRAADYAGALLGALGEIARALAGLEPAVAYEAETRRIAAPQETSDSTTGIVVGVIVLVAAVGLIVLFAISPRWRRGGAFALEITLSICHAVASAQGSSSGWSSGSSSSSWGSRSSSGSTSSRGSSYSSPSWKGGGGKFGGGGASSSW